MTETTFKTILFVTPIVYWGAVFCYVFYQAGKGNVGYFYFADKSEGKSTKTDGWDGND